MFSVCFVHCSYFIPHFGTPTRITSRSTPSSSSRHHVAIRHPGSKIHELIRIRTNSLGSSQSALRMKTSESDSTSLSTKIGAMIVVASLIIGTFVPLIGLIRNSSTGVGSAMLETQLKRVPVFTVTDMSGRPYLSETEDGRLRRGYFFVKPEDAQLYLERVRSDSADAKVLTISLNEAYKFLSSKPTSGKAFPERFELFPDDHQLAVAQEVTGGAFEQVFGKNGVPIFYIDGLGIKESKSDKTIYPLFFEKEKLDETVNNLKRMDPNATIDLKDVQVIDLEQTIKEIQTGINSKLNSIMFVPLSDAMEKLKDSSKQ